MATNQLYECRFCKEKFHPALARDLHVLAKHPSEWAAPPFYTKSGIFSLATNDLLKIAQREFGSLRSVSIDDLKKSKPLFEWTPPAMGQEKMAEVRKRRLDENGEKQERPRKKEKKGENPRRDSGFGSESERRKRSSRDSSDGRTSRTSSNDSSDPWNVTTFVAKSVSLSRRNRLEMVGKPYYRQESSRSERRPKERRETTFQEVHAFKCYPKNQWGDETRPGAIYVFQPKDAVDLLRNLTWKSTKSQRQRREAKEGKDSENRPPNGGQPKFKKHVHSLDDTKDYADKTEDRRYSYEIEAYKNDPHFRNRVRRGFLYDARFRKVQVQADGIIICELKNALHLYLLQTPAGDRGMSMSESPFRCRDYRSQSVLSGRSTSSR